MRNNIKKHKISIFLSWKKVILQILQKLVGRKLSSNMLELPFPVMWENWNLKIFLELRPMTPAVCSFASLSSFTWFSYSWWWTWYSHDLFFWISEKKINLPVIYVQLIHSRVFLQPWWWMYDYERKVVKLSHSGEFQKFQFQNFLQPWWRY